MGSSLKSSSKGWYTDKADGRCRWDQYCWFDVERLITVLITLELDHDIEWTQSHQQKQDHSTPADMKQNTETVHHCSLYSAITTAALSH